MSQYYEIIRANNAECAEIIKTIGEIQAGTRFAGFQYRCIVGIPFGQGVELVLHCSNDCCDSARALAKELTGSGFAVFIGEQMDKSGFELYFPKFPVSV